MAERRDLKNAIKRSRKLGDIHSSDLIFKKAKLKEILLNDPDLMNALGKQSQRPLNKYADPSNPTEKELAERIKIEDYNEKITHEQIVPWIKLNGVQAEVLNFIMYDIEDERPDYDNQGMKQQILTIMCVVNESDMYTEYGVDIEGYDFEKGEDGEKYATMYMIPRTDLLSFIIKDLLTWTNALGSQLKCSSDVPRIVDNGYYVREMKFVIKVPNTTPNHAVHHNRYDDESYRI